MCLWCRLFGFSPGSWWFLNTSELEDDPIQVDLYDLTYLPGYFTFFVPGFIIGLSIIFEAEFCFVKITISHMTLTLTSKF